MFVPVPARLISLPPPPPHTHTQVPSIARCRSDATHCLTLLGEMRAEGPTGGRTPLLAARTRSCTHDARTGPWCPYWVMMPYHPFLGVTSQIRLTDQHAAGEGHKSIITIKGLSVSNIQVDSRTSLMLGVHARGYMPDARGSMPDARGYTEF